MQMFDFLKESLYRNIGKGYSDELKKVKGLVVVPTNQIGISLGFKQFVMSTPLTRRGKKKRIISLISNL